MKKIIQTGLIIVVGFLILHTTLPQANAQGWTQGKEAVSSAKTGLPETPARDVIFNILKWLLSVVFILAVLAFVGSGVIFIASFGNPAFTGAAKNWLTFAIIGLAVSILGFIIVLTISRLLSGENLTGNTGSSSGGIINNPFDTGIPHEPGVSGSPSPPFL